MTRTEPIRLPAWEAEAIARRLSAALVAAGSAASAIGVEATAQGLLLHATIHGTRAAIVIPPYATVEFDLAATELLSEAQRGGHARAAQETH